MMKRILPFLLLALPIMAAGQKVTDEPALTTTATGDVIRIVDVSDTTDDAAGSTKQITVANLLALLHGNLNVNSNAIVSSSAGDISLTPDTTGNVVLDGLYWPQADGTEGQWLTTDGSTQIAFSSDILELQDLDFDPVNAEVLISTGALTLTQTYTQVGAESGTSDTIDSIAWTGADNGAIAILYPTSGDTLTFANGTAGGDNLDLGADVVLDSVNERLILQYNGTNWVQLANSANIETVEKTISETFTILEPDAVQGVSDDIVLKKFVAEDYPNGVTINAIHIDASAAYTSETFLFEHWDDASGTTQATVESIAASAISTEDDGTLSDATIPADYFLVVNLDDTPEDKAYVSITIQYTVD